MSAELVQAWHEAAADLGIRVRANADAVIVDDFGRANGTLCSIVADRDGERELRERAERLKMSYSVLSRTYERYQREVYMDMLNDWGWMREGPAPSWYTGEPWTR